MRNICARISAHNIDEEIDVSALMTEGPTNNCSPNWQSTQLNQPSTTLCNTPQHIRKRLCLFLPGWLARAKKRL